MRFDSDAGTRSILLLASVIAIATLLFVGGLIASLFSEDNDALAPSTEETLQPGLHIPDPPEQQEPEVLLGQPMSRFGERWHSEKSGWRWHDREEVIPGQWTQWTARNDREPAISFILGGPDESDTQHWAFTTTIMFDREDLRLHITERIAVAAAMTGEVAGCEMSDLGVFATSAFMAYLEREEDYGFASFEDAVHPVTIIFASGKGGVAVVFSVGSDQP